MFYPEPYIVALIDSFVFLVSGLLHVGDIIKEINGIDVTNDPDALQEHMKAAEGNVTLKILPSYKDHVPAPPVSTHNYFDPCVV